MVSFHSVLYVASIFRIHAYFRLIKGRVTLIRPETSKGSLSSVRIYLRNLWFMTFFFLFNRCITRGGLNRCASSSQAYPNLRMFPKISFNVILHGLNYRWHIAHPRGEWLVALVTPLGVPEMPWLEWKDGTPNSVYPRDGNGCIPGENIDAQNPSCPRVKKGYPEENNGTPHV